MIRNMKKIRLENNVTNRTSVINAEIEIEHDWSDKMQSILKSK